MDILRDPAFVAILTIALFVLGIYTYLRQRRRKGLALEVLHATPLMSLNDEVKGKIKIVFNQRKINDVYLVVLEIYNSGNVPILSEDYVRPITVEFDEETEVLDAEILERMPSNLEASLTQDGKRIYLAPTLLNPEDSLKLKLLLTRYGGKIKAEWRIAGVKEGIVEKSTTEPKANNDEDTPSATVISVGKLSHLTLAQRDTPNRVYKRPNRLRQRVVNILIFLIFTVGLVSCLMATTSENNFRSAVTWTTKGDFCSAAQDMKTATSNADNYAWTHLTQRKPDYPC